MSQPTIPYQAPTLNPELKDVFEVWKRHTQLTTNCHAIGTIQSFSPGSPGTPSTATVKINYSRTYFQPVDASGAGTAQQFQPIHLDYPLLVDVPVVVLSGGNVSLTFPIAQGDQCLVLFNDRNIDTWLSSPVPAVAGQKVPPVSSARLHDLADGIALVGLVPAVGNYSTTHGTLKNGSTQVGVSSSQVLIANNTYTLGAVLGTFMTSLSTATTVAQVAAAAGIAQTALANLLES